VTRLSFDFIAVDVVAVAEYLANELGCTFDVSLNKSRLYPLDHPEIMVTALLVFGATLTFPLKGGPSMWRSDQPVRFNWKTWAHLRQAFAEQQPKVEEETNFEAITAEQVTAMDDKQLDQYFAHVAGLIEERSELTFTSNGNELMTDGV
jgi:hypothetical protein